MENVVSNAERRALTSHDDHAVARVTDVYAALPSITGKFEMEYEGELKGAETVARDIIRSAVATVADGYLSHLETRQVIEWFDLGGSLQLSDTMSAADVLQHAQQVQGLVELTRARRHSEECVGAAAGLGHRLRPRGPVRDQEDQPQRRARLSRQRSRTAPADARGDAEGRDADADCWREGKEVLQLVGSW